MVWINFNAADYENGHPIINFSGKDLKSNPSKTTSSSLVILIYASYPFHLNPFTTTSLTRFAASPSPVPTFLGYEFETNLNKIVK